MSRAAVQKNTERLHGVLLRAGFAQDVWGHYFKEIDAQAVPSIRNLLKGAVRLRITLHASSARIEARNLDAGSAWHFITGGYIHRITYPDEKSIRLGRHIFT